MIRRGRLMAVALLLLLTDAGSYRLISRKSKKRSSTQIIGNPALLKAVAKHRSRNLLSGQVTIDAHRDLFDGLDSGLLRLFEKNGEYVSHEWRTNRTLIVKTSKIEINIWLNPGRNGIDQIAVEPLEFEEAGSCFWMPKTLSKTGRLNVNKFDTVFFEEDTYCPALKTLQLANIGNVKRPSGNWGNIDKSYPDLESVLYRNCRSDSEDLKEIFGEYAANEIRNAQEKPITFNELHFDLY